MNLVNRLAEKAGVEFMPHVSFGLFVLAVFLMVVGCFVGGNYIAGMILAVHGMFIVYLFERVIKRFRTKE